MTSLVLTGCSQQEQAQKPIYQPKSVMKSVMKPQQDKQTYQLPLEAQNPESLQPDFPKELTDYLASGQGQEIGRPFDNDYRLLVLKIGGDWCSSCRKLTDIIKQENNQGFLDENKIKVVEVDCDKNKDLAGLYDYKMLPAMIYYDAKTGKQVLMREGMRDENLFKERIEIALRKLEDYH